MADTTAIDVALRRQAIVERLKQSRFSETQTLRANIEKIVSDQLAPLLSKSSLSELSPREFQSLITRLTKGLSGVLTEYKLDTLDWLEDLSGAEAHIAAGVLEQVSGKTIGDLDVADIWSTVSKAFIPGNGLTLADTLQSGSDYTMGLIIRRLRTGWVDGEKPEDTLRAMLGTDALNNKDGIMTKLENAFRAGSSTSIQHVTTKTNEQVSAGNVKYYQYVAVMDDRTTVICQDRNGNVYVVGEGPLPPAHYNCRSTTVDLDSPEPIAAPANREEWLDEQPADVKDYINPHKALSLADYAANALRYVLRGFKGR